MYSYKETNKIILEIKKRPAIYNRNHADYNNKEVREQMWTDICWELFPNWSDLDEFDRGMRFKDIQKKWRNVRDSFRKEIKIQARIKGGAIRKKRQYVYYKQMRFMIPFILEPEILQENLNQDQLDNFSTENTKIEHEDDENDDEDEDDDEDGSEIIQFKFENEDTLFSNLYNNSRDGEENGEADKPILEMWDNSAENGFRCDSNYSSQKDIDEDRYFLLSLIPSFKNLSRQQKLTAKVEFLQVLQRISSSSSEKT